MLLYSKIMFICDTWFDFASNVSIEGRLTSEHLRLHSPVEQQFVVSRIVLRCIVPCVICVRTRYQIWCVEFSGTDDIRGWE